MKKDIITEIVENSIIIHEENGALEFSRIGKPTVKVLAKKSDVNDDINFVYMIYNNLFTASGTKPEIAVQEYEELMKKHIVVLKALRNTLIRI